MSFVRRPLLPSHFRFNRRREWPQTICRLGRSNGSNVIDWPGDPEGAKARAGIQFNDHCDDLPADVVFRHACKLGFEGIVSKARERNSADAPLIQRPELAALQAQAGQPLSHPSFTPVNASVGPVVRPGRSEACLNRIRAWNLRPACAFGNGSHCKIPLRDIVANPPESPAFNEHIATSATRPGWTVAAVSNGRFVKIGPAKVEYDYYDFSARNLTLPESATRPTLGANPATTSCGTQSCRAASLAAPQNVVALTRLGRGC